MKLVIGTWDKFGILKSVLIHFPVNDAKPVCSILLSNNVDIGTERIFKGHMAPSSSNSLRWSPAKLFVMYLFLLNHSIDGHHDSLMV